MVKWETMWEGLDNQEVCWVCLVDCLARRIFTSFIVTHVSILTSDTSSDPHGSPSQAYRTLLYRALTRARSFGTWFEPRYIFRAGRLDQ